MGFRGATARTYKTAAFARFARISAGLLAALALSEPVVAEAVVAAPAETTLFGFDGQTGLSPQTGLVRDGNGNLYGVTAQGGVNFFPPQLGFGVAYKLAPPATPGGPWTETIIHQFGQAAGDGVYPTGPLLPYEDGFYGATGSGAIFRLGPPIAHDGTYAETILYTFSGPTDGSGPNGGLIMDQSGALYGTTEFGGTGTCNGLSGGTTCGTVFRLNPPATPGGPWTETQLYSFQGGAAGDGAYPTAGLVMDAAGNLYGVTSYGGGTGCSPGAGVLGCGTVFELSPPATPGAQWTETVLYRFKDGTDGAQPSSSLLLVHGILYGVTFGDTNAGTAYALTPPKTKGGTWTETTLHRFTNPNDGMFPAGTLIMTKSGAQDVLIGTTYAGGISSQGCFTGGCGLVFSLTAPPNAGGTWTESILYEFTGSIDGGLPRSGVIMDRTGTLYGTTEAGGWFSNCEGYPAVGCGAVFEITP